jgi:hypothetical protein
MYSFCQLPGRPRDWDALIANYDTKTLFHEAAWLDHIQDIHPSGRIEYFEIQDGTERIGLYCAQRITKMGLPIHGSPLGGTGTNFMGPLTDRHVDQRALIEGLLSLAGPRRFLHLELSNFSLDRSVLEAAGFQVHRSVTHLVPIGPNEDIAWEALRSEARNRIRKAERNGLIVDSSADPRIVREFFDQFTEVYAKQGKVTPFGIDRVQSLYGHLASAGRLLVLAVRHNDKVAACGFFPFDERCIYFWGAASWLAQQKFYPNELLHWHVIKFAVARGIPAYNMCGGTSQFKNKFGGEDVEYLHFSRSSLPGLQVLRKAYRAYHFRRLKQKRTGGFATR